MSLVIGVDFGTDSVRAVVIDAMNGREQGSGVFAYPRWKSGLYSDPLKSRFRQHPKDYSEGLEASIRAALACSPEGSADRVVAIGIGMTGSTPAPVNAEGVPLAMLPEFAENPDAMFVLWKDHTANSEAIEINELAGNWPDGDYTRFSGGTYSSEWYWSKALHLLRSDPAVAAAAKGFIECSDWIPALLTDTAHPSVIKRNRCASGHKAMWNAAWGGLPPAGFFLKLDPKLAALRDLMPAETYTVDTAAGTLCPEWALRLGLSTDVWVTCGAIDAHMGAIGGGVKPGTLLKVVGTSTCDMVVVEPGVMGDRLIDGICGQVDGSIIPGLLGVEAGQSAFGDIFAWFKSFVSWPVDQAGLDPEQAAAITDSILMKLEAKALKIPAGESSVLATDWFNGRRTPHANQLLKAGITGLTLGADAPLIYKALVEAACFGSKRINDCMVEQGINIDEVVCVGGVARKSRLVMQTLADVLNVPVKVAAAEQGCALGCVMAAAVVAGLYETVTEAQAAMGAGIAETYIPIPDDVSVYGRKYKEYLKLGAFSEE
jgi:L-ribulokinase